MRHVNSLEEAALDQPSVLTIGKFDGVHSGHQLLVGQLVEHAHATGRVPVVLFFFPDPRMVLQGFQPHYYLTLPEERARLLGQLGVKVVISQPFNEKLRDTPADDYLDQLITHTKMTSLWVGKNFAMGYKRQGNVSYLRAKSKEFGFDLRVTDLMDDSEGRISSSRIREAIRDGDLIEASALLGRAFRLHGTVVEGAKRGRTIGFPTANLDVPDALIIPGRGVYAAWAGVNDEIVPSVVNIGLRPTFGENLVTSVEAHLLDYKADLYGKQLTLDFVARLRDEMKFNGIDELVAQIGRDVQAGRALLADTPQPKA